MNVIAVQYYKAPVGELILGEFEGALCLCDWRYRKMRVAIDRRIQKGLAAGYQERSTPVTEATMRQLDSYFQGKLEVFDLPMQFVGTVFQQDVWRALMTIPYGTTESYLSLSCIINNETAIRAVASANGANAISIIVPCHRIIGSNGALTGYAGGLLAKKRLLQLESKPNIHEQLRLF